MLRSLRKAAASVERSMETAFSNAPASHTAFTGTTLTIAGITLKLGNVFAEGGYSLVHVAKPLHSSSTTTRYAVKRISCPDQDAHRQAEHEIRFLRSLPPHPNIVKFYDAIFYHAHAFLLFELVDGGTLPERLASVTFDAPHRLDIFADAVAAVAHLHAQNPPVAIRDVKLENLLYDRFTKSYKLCDFGSATTVTRRPASRTEILAEEEDVASNCTAMYRAPELVNLYSKQFICERVDIWALGCVWYAILFRNLPFDGQSSMQITRGLQHIPTHPPYPDEYITMLKSMLDVDPATRWDAFRVLESVTKLQGKPMDPTLFEIGCNARHARASDFGLEQATNSAPSNDLLQDFAENTTVRPSFTGKVHLAMTSSATDDLLNLNSSDLQQTSNRLMPTQTRGDENEWADFDSVFGGSAEKPPTSLPAPSSSPAPIRVPVETTKPARHSVSSAGNASLSMDTNAPLLDFSDVSISSSSKQTPMEASIMQTWGQARTSTKTPSPRSNDLIDFG